MLNSLFFPISCSTLQMLTNIENRLEELFEQIEIMPTDRVEMAEKVGKLTLISLPSSSTLTYSRIVVRCFEFDGIRPQVAQAMVRL